MMSQTMDVMIQLKTGSITGWIIMTVLYCHQLVAQAW